MKRCFFVVFAVASLIFPTARAQPAPITVPATEQERLGISTALLAEREIRQTVEAFARVLDIEPLAALDAEIAAARAASHASARNAARLKQLAAQDQAVSQEALEAGQAQAAADAARHDLAERRVRLEWGSSLAHMSLEARMALVAEIASAKAAVLRVDAPDRDIGAAIRVALTPSPSMPPITASVLGPAVSVDPRLQNVGLLALVRGEAAQALRPGRVFPAEIDTGGRKTGVLVPRGALVRVDDATWVYVRSSPETFARRKLSAAVITPDGWLVSSGLAPGETVVDRGAGSLLAIERGSSSDEGD